MECRGRRCGEDEQCPPTRPSALYLLGGASPGPYLVMTTAIESRDLSRAEDLLEAIHPREPRYLPEPRRWVFRGQSDSRWNLEPSVFRAAAWQPFAHGTDHIDHATESREGFETLSRALTRLLAAFLRGLDEGGLVVPGDSSAIRDYLARSGDDGDVFFEKEFGPLLALARHHGLPTPLLDWSWESRVAAYFAAVDAAGHASLDGHLCVWAFDTLFAEEFWRPGDGRISIIEVPRATNPNLHAQSGLFTTCGGLAGWYELRGYVEHLWSAAVADGLQPPSPAVWRFLLPWSEARRLLRLLAYERVDGARLFPGPDGVVRRLRERILWDESSLVG
jgi:hypothetical protein